MMTDLLLPIVALGAVYFGLNAVDVEFAGPFSVLAALAVIAWRFGFAPTTLARLGLGAPRAWWIVPLGAVAIIAVMVVVIPFVVRPITTALGWPAQDFSKLGDLHGNLARLALLLLIAWTTAAFGEEIVFRGFLIPQLEKVLGGGGLAIAAAIVLQALLFGLAHSVQGPTGALQAGAAALVFGIAFIVFGRNLWPLILAHGLIDTLSLVALYAGARPA